MIAALLLTDARRSAALAHAAFDPAVEIMADALAWADGTPNHVDDIIPTEPIALHRAMFDPDARTTVARALLSRPASDRLTIAHPAGVLDTLLWLSVPDVLRAIDLGPPATDPLAVIGRAAMRRDLARLTGDAGRAAAWQAIALRHVEAFSSYTALTALMVRELLRAADPGARIQMLDSER